MVMIVRAHGIIQNDSELLREEVLILRHGGEMDDELCQSADPEKNIWM